MMQSVLIVGEFADAEMKLRAMDYFVSTAATGPRAFDALRYGYLPHLILVALPPGEEIRFVEEVKGHPFLSHVPIVIVADERPKELGWLVYAPVPIDDDDLFALVRRFAR